MIDLIEYDKTETYMILKYGSMQAAYNNWMERTLDERTATPLMEYELLMEFEYNQQMYRDPRPYEPR